MNRNTLNCLAAASLAFSVTAAAEESPPAGTAPIQPDPEARHERPSHRQSPIVQLVREAAGKYRSVENAVADGYAGGPCVSGPEFGAMGIHYVNEGLLNDGAIDPMRPEALVYEPGPNGRLRLVAVEYITFAQVWDGVNEGPPVLNGHQFNYVGEPNRSRLPAFYELHVWAWRQNPMGTFADFNPRVSCDAFDPAPPPDQDVTAR